MFSGALLLLLLLAAGSCVHCALELTQPDSVVVRPGESLTITCQVSGYSLTDSSNVFGIAWIRLAAGKTPEWIWNIYHDGSSNSHSSLRNRFSVTRDTSSSTVTLTGQSLQPEDTAVYYCARYEHSSGPAYDYWGKGTMVTVTSATPTIPTVFPLVQCDSGTGDMLTLGCLATGFTPSSLTFKWTDASGTALTNFVQYPPVQKNNLYTGVSQVSITRANWDSKDIFKCVVEHEAGISEVVFQEEEEKVVHEQLPVLKVLTSSKEELEKQTTASFACFATDFSPSEHEITWLRNGLQINENQRISEIKTPSSESKTSENGTLYSAASYLEVETYLWIDAKTKFTCVFTSKPSAKSENKTVTYSMADKCQETQCPNDFVDVKIVPISLEEMFFNRKTEVVCEVLQLQGIIESVKWEDQDGNEILNKSETESYRDGTRLISVAVDVVYQEWSKGLKYYCVVVHKDLFNSVKAPFIRQNGEVSKRPSVFLLPPVQQTSNNTVTLTCYVTDFYPKEVIVSWLVDDEPVARGSPKYAFDTTNLIQKNGYYSVYGQLTLSSDNWKRDEVIYSCVVYHESVIDTTRILVRSMVERTSDKINLVNLSVNIPQTCKAL